MNKLRIAAYFLCAATLVSLTATACGSTSPDSSDSTTDDGASTPQVTETDTEPVDALEARKNVKDNLGTYDFKNYEFRIATSDGNGVHWVQDADASDIVDVAVYQRNLAVSERFNCSFSVIDLAYNLISGFMTQNVNAGEDAFDLAAVHEIEMGKITINDLFLNWYDIPNVDFSMPWWSDSTVNDLTYKGVCVTAVGDAALTSLASTCCVFYNKVIGERYDMPDMYEIVRNGEWTYDRAVALSRDVYEDLDKDGEKDNDDLYGYTSDPQSHMNAYLWAFDNPVFKKDGDILTFTYKTEKMPEIITKLLDTFNVYDGMRSDVNYISPLTNASHWYSIDMFAKSQSMFSNAIISMSLSQFRDLKDDFAILPYPKWDEEQASYITLADGANEVMSVPLTATEWERIGTITEALCAESYKTLVPAYYDKALKVKGARDAESIEMLDLLVNSRVFDFGYVYDGWQGCSFFMQQMFGKGTKNFESYWQQREKAVMKHYDDVVAYFENYDH